MADARRPGEFELIRRHFAPLAAVPGGLELLDDAALYHPPAGQEVVLTADAMVAGVHFLEDDPAPLVARKLLRVNLSDLAAMGAMPVGYLVTAAWPRGLDEDWIAGFAAGLAEDQARFGVRLYGGDTVATDGPLALSLTAFGTVAEGRAIRRRGARPGDRVHVTGSVGDGALGLLAARGGLADLDAGDRDYLLARYRLPEPRVELGPRLLGLATAMLDVSDGLVADAGHIAEVSGVGIVLRQPAVPLSRAGGRAVAGDARLDHLVLSGGDDYELLFTAGAEASAGLAALSADSGLAITEIGEVVAGSGVTVVDRAGAAIALESTGWRHF